MLLEKLMDEYRQILAKEERAEEDKARAKRVKAESLRDYGEQMLMTSLGCPVRELLADVNAYHVDERLGMLIVKIPLIVPGVFLNCTSSTVQPKTDTGARIDVRTVYLCDAGADDETVRLPAPR